MRWTGFLGAGLVLSCFLGPSGLVAQEAVTGRWEGEVRISGQVMPIAVVFRMSGGALAAALDIQGRTGVPLQNVSQEGPRIRFELSVPEAQAAFAGTVAGDRIEGTFTQASAGTFLLTRVQPVELDGPIQAFMEEHHVPGLAAAAVRDGEVVWVGTYGFADVEQEKPVTDETLFMLASVSKTLTATTLMTLHAEGRFELDDDVSDYLPFVVRNPAFAHVPITFADLLRHRSSIRDNMGFYGPFWGTPRGDQDVPLGDYLKSYLAQGGEHFDPAQNYFQERPGTEFHYCNTCYALVGYLAERISGTSFQDLSAEALLEPLGMTATGWFYRDVDADRVAIGYRFDEEDGHVPYGPVGYPDWPAGQMRSTVTELSRFLAAYTQFGRLEGASVMDSATVELMAPRHQAVGYYTWFASSFPETGSVLYTHGGGDLGARTLIGFDSATRNGFVLLTNGEAAVEEVGALIYGAIPTLGWSRPVS